MSSMVIETSNGEKHEFYAKHGTLRTILPNEEEVIVTSLKKFALNDKLFFYYQPKLASSANYYLSSYEIIKVTASSEKQNRFISILLDNNEFIDFIIDNNNLIGNYKNKKMLIGSLLFLLPNDTLESYYYNIENDIVSSTVEYYNSHAKIYSIV